MWLKLIAKPTEQKMYLIIYKQTIICRWFKWKRISEEQKKTSQIWRLEEEVGDMYEIDQWFAN